MEGLNIIINLIININKCRLFNAGAFNKLSKSIKDKHAIVNVELFNDDDDDFIRAIVSILYLVKVNKIRISSYPHYKDVLNLTDVTFSMTVNQISTSESNNISIS